MINRSLIRIKTIQILYSYLLTRTDFKLAEAPQPGESARDRQIAYSVYLDLITLLLKLSGLPLVPGSGIKHEVDAGLQKNKVGKALREDSAVIALLGRNRDRLARFDTCIPELLQAIYDSAIFKDYKRKRILAPADDVTFWTTVFSTIIRKSKGVERVLRRDENFSHVGFDEGVRMFVDTLNSFNDTKTTYLKARTDLAKSLTMAYNLYHSLLMLPVLITDLQAQRLDNAKHKYLPTPEDLNPNLRFVENLFVQSLRDCQALTDYIAENPEADPSTWRDCDIMLAGLLDKITTSDIYARYMDSAAGNYADDASFWRDVMRTIVVPSDELAEALEGMSVYWNDDLAIMSTFVLKTIRRSYASVPSDDEPAEDADTPVTGGVIELLPKFMNAEDEAFGASLFEYVVQNRETYRAYIDRFIDTKQWDTERLAFMDIVIMLTAIAEIVKFPSIPVPVTLNEYIEIANDYSTARSGQFINGILSSVIKALNAEGVINKQI